MKLNIELCKLGSSEEEFLQHSHDSLQTSLQVISIEFNSFRRLFLLNLPIVDRSFFLFHVENFVCGKMRWKMLVYPNM